MSLFPFLLVDNDQCFLSQSAITYKFNQFLNLVQSIEPLEVGTHNGSGNFTCSRERRCMRVLCRRRQTAPWCLCGGDATASLTRLVGGKVAGDGDGGLRVSLLKDVTRTARSVVEMVDTMVLGLGRGAGADSGCYSGHLFRESG
jgi:hypothetical protein